MTTTAVRVALQAMDTHEAKLRSEMYNAEGERYRTLYAKQQTFKACAEILRECLHLSDKAGNMDVCRAVAFLYPPKANVIAALVEAGAALEKQLNDPAATLDEGFRAADKIRDQARAALKKAGV